MTASGYLDKISDILAERKAQTAGPCWVYATPTGLRISECSIRSNEPTFVIHLSGDTVSKGLTNGQWNAAHLRLIELCKKGLLP